MIAFELILVKLALR